jgi:hypothetical protein
MLWRRSQEVGREGDGGDFVKVYGIHEEGTGPEMDDEHVASNWYGIFNSQEDKYADSDRCSDGMARFYAESSKLPRRLCQIRVERLMGNWSTMARSQCCNRHQLQL